MSRSLKKGPYVDLKLAQKVAAQQKSGKKDPIKTWARSCTITPDFVGTTFLVHNGRHHFKVLITEDMVGHKLGEFAATRVFKGHTNKKEAEKTDTVEAGA
jgi:small subunit ribosomal protein S19